MPEQRQILVRNTDPDPRNPRKDFPQQQLVEFAADLKALGQLVPVIAYQTPETNRYTLVDGEKRWRACQLAAIATMDAIIWERRPTPYEVSITQWRIDAHRTNLAPMERSDLLVRIKEENQWSIGELAEKLSMKQPLVTKLLKFQDGCEELRAALRAGSIDQDKAYTLACEPDHARQRELLKDAGGLTREQLRQKARSGGKPVELRTAVARFQVSKSVTVIVQAPRIDLSAAITALSNTVQALKKGQREGYDVVTASRVLADRARSAN